MRSCQQSAPRAAVQFTGCAYGGRRSSMGVGGYQEAAVATSARGNSEYVALCRVLALDVSSACAEPFHLAERHRSVQELGAKGACEPEKYQYGVSTHAAVSSRDERWTNLAVAKTSDRRGRGIVPVSATSSTDQSIGRTSATSFCFTACLKASTLPVLSPSNNAATAFGEIALWTILCSHPHTPVQSGPAAAS